MEEETTEVKQAFQRRYNMYTEEVKYFRATHDEKWNRTADYLAKQAQRQEEERQKTH